MSDSDYRNKNRVASGILARIIAAAALIIAFCYAFDAKAETRVVCNQGNDFTVCVLLLIEEDEEPEDIEV